MTSGGGRSVSSGNEVLHGLAQEKGSYSLIAKRDDPITRGCDLLERRTAQGVGEGSRLGVYPGPVVIFPEVPLGFGTVVGVECRPRL
jgi:hypothetical protein